MNPLETYLRELRDIRSSGAAVQETSYYGALANLLNHIGATLKPKVRCIIQVRNQGAGLPDGGLFTSVQIQRVDQTALMTSLLPERGVIEVKGTGEDAWAVADSEQVLRYWSKYRQVLVTNYWDFVLVAQDVDGRPIQRETYRLAESEAAFWMMVADPQAAAQAQGERFLEYVKRILLHAAPLATPEDVAWFLASYARDAKARIARAELPALEAVRAALEEALGLTFEGEKGDHFFRSTLVQTLFYGVFSAWVLWSKQHPPQSRATFDWRTAAWELHVPMIRALFHQVSDPNRLEPLGLVEVLDWTAGALNRIDRAAFFEKFEAGHAVQYFYEPFLQAFDPELRKQLGVWYTPPEIVEYMVARVDTVLREELDLPDGLADPNVYVLDPCCGTGAYLVEVLKRIASTLQAQDGDALGGYDVKKAAMERVFGFEILPAPFVIAHLQLGLLLQNLGAPLLDRQNERAGVYLTNALTGWEPPKTPKHQLIFPELHEEREAAGHVKRDVPILVILGNPPYNAFAGVSPKEEQGLVEPYKAGLISRWGIKKFNLDDLYIRFFRLAERRIAERTGKGIVCYISNHSWLSDPSFVVLRQHLLESFDRFWIENMHGNRKISEYAPDGKTSETIFAIPGFSVGIQQGVAISLWVKTGQDPTGAQVLFRDDLNAAKAVERRAQLLTSLNATDFNAAYQGANPEASNRYSFRPSRVDTHYQDWPNLIELCAVTPSNGLMEKRGGAMMNGDRSILERRMRAYFDPNLSWGQYAALGYGLTERQARFEPKTTRSKAIAAEKFMETRLVRYALRPFEVRWCYYTGIRPVWNEPRPSLWAQCWEGNRFLLTRFNAAKDPEGPPFYFTPCLSDDHILSPDAVAIPLQLKNGIRLEKQDEATLFSVLGEKPEIDVAVANLSKLARAYLTGLGIDDPDADAQTAGLIWMHALAIGYSPAYLTENADGIRQDWPRIPLPNSKEALLASALLGRQVAALLDTETPIPGVTTGTIRSELRTIGVISRVGGGSLHLEMSELAVTAGWGHAGKEGVTMPARGKIIGRDYTPAERTALADSAATAQLTLDQIVQALGGATNDVYLNSVAYWRNVPSRVWDYTVGGYQVIKKWLSYREQPLLGRPLSLEEAREVTVMARRIAALLLLTPALDANYHAIKVVSSAIKREGTQG